MDNLKSFSQSRRDNTLLTVGFSLRYRRHLPSLSPARAILENVSSPDISEQALRDFGERERSHVRRLKPTVNKVLSLQDITTIENKQFLQTY
jgi:hypothetical protein